MQFFINQLNTQPLTFKNYIYMDNGQQPEYWDGAEGRLIFTKLVIIFIIFIKKIDIHIAS